MHHTRLCLVATLLCCVAAAPVRASEVYGYGTIDTNLSDPESWSGDVRTTENENGCAGSPEPSRFVPLPGEEPRFTQETGGGRSRH